MAKKTKKTASVPSVPKKTSSVPCVPKQNNSNYLDENTKVRSMSIQCYCPPERWERLLKESYRYAYILHDKDVDAEGKPKTPHYHIVVRFSFPRYRNAVLKLFDLDGLTEDTTVNFQKVKSLSNVFSYLTHDTALAIEEGKYRYPADSVISNDISYFNTIAERVTSYSDSDVGDYTLNSTFLEDLTSEDFDLRTMSLRYGRDFMKNYRTYQKLRYDILQTEANVQLVKRRREATTEMEALLCNVDNAEVIPNDVDVISRYILDNVVGPKACDYGSQRFLLEDFLNAVKTAVMSKLDF